MSDLTARYQPYTICILDSRSLGGFASRQLVTFPSRHIKNNFILFLRRKCASRRRGSWVLIPGSGLMNRAIDYAAIHGSFVYNIPLKKGPTHRKCLAGEDCDAACQYSEGEVVPEEDLHSDAEGI